MNNIVRIQKNGLIIHNAFINSVNNNAIIVVWASIDIRYNTSFK